MEVWGEDDSRDVYNKSGLGRYYMKSEVEAWDFAHSTARGPSLVLFLASGLPSWNTTNTAPSVAISFIASSHSPATTKHGLRGKVVPSLRCFLQHQPPPFVF